LVTFLHTAAVRAMKEFSESATPNRLAAVVALSKPTITMTSVMMGLGGLALAQQSLTVAAVLGTIIGIAGTVAAANALNMVIERDSDARMKRTMTRPIPSGLISANAGILAGIIYAGVGLASLVLFANTVTAAVGLAALIVYVAVYTPLKKVSPWALVVGAIPGAAPPLMGWTAATGSLDTAGFALFSVLFLWQVPHFIGISVWRKDDYARAGMPTYGVVRCERTARYEAFAYALALIPMSAILVIVGQATWFFGAVSAALGLWFAAKALERRDDWSRKLFLASLIYLPVAVLCLAVDHLFFL
jgi:protoheme IX farnesyltransferase